VSQPVPVRFAHRITSESASALATRGVSTSSGRSSSTRLTASRTSLAALSMSRLVVNSMLMLERPVRLLEVSRSTPSMPLTASSSTWVMRVSTTAAEAPV
jgi:hypothetical protein